MTPLAVTERLRLFASAPVLARLVAEFFVRNREFLAPTEPAQPPEFFTVAGQRKILRAERRAQNKGEALRLWLMPLHENRIIGAVSLGNILMGSFCSAFVGYRLDKEETGKGYMHEALRQLVDIAFNQVGLHRLEANIMPRNASSLRVAKRLGFEEEGLAKQYVSIAGKWEDHIHMVLLNPAIEP